MVFSIGQPTHFDGIYSKETNNSKVEKLLAHCFFKCDT